MSDIRIAYSAGERKIAVIGCAALALMLAGFAAVLDIGAHGSGLWTAPVMMSIVGTPPLVWMLNSTLGSTVITEHGVTVSCLTSRRVIPWGQVTGLEVRNREARGSTYQVARLHRTFGSPVTVLGMMRAQDQERARACAENVTLIRARWSKATGRTGL